MAFKKDEADDDGSKAQVKPIPTKNTLSKQAEPSTATKIIKNDPRDYLDDAARKRVRDMIAASRQAREAQLIKEGKSPAATSRMGIDPPTHRSSKNSEL